MPNDKEEVRPGTKVLTRFKGTLAEATVIGKYKDQPDSYLLEFNDKVLGYMLTKDEAKAVTARLVDGCLPIRPDRSYAGADRGKFTIISAPGPVEKKSKETGAGHPCTCSLQTLMRHGCQCGGR